jgi:hypothetical protein
MRLILLLFMNLPIDPARQFEPECNLFDQKFIWQNHIRSIIIENEGGHSSQGNGIMYFDHEGRMEKMILYKSDSSVYEYSAWRIDSSGCPQEFDEQNEQQTVCRCDENHRIVFTSNLNKMTEYLRDDSGRIIKATTSYDPTEPISSRMNFSYDNEGRCKQTEIYSLKPSMKAGSLEEEKPEWKQLVIQFDWLGNQLIEMKQLAFHDDKNLHEEEGLKIAWPDPLTANVASINKSGEVDGRMKVSYYPIGLVKEIEIRAEGAIRPEDEVQTMRFTYETW